jgi:hypothetical protein
MNAGERGVTDGGVSLRIVVAPDPDLDAEKGERLTRQLRTEIAELDVESVDLAAESSVPDGAKAVDPAMVGAIVVALSASGGVLPTVVGTVRDWLGRQSRPHRVSMTIGGESIEMDRASADQQRALVDAFVRRHSAK